MEAVLESDLSSDEASLWTASVADFPQFQYSKREVMRAGETIAGAPIWNDQTAPEIRHAFLVANNWRDAHAYPMRSIRRQLIWYMGNRQLDGITGARLKRMHAIRRKLQRDDLPMHLNQLQDLGGCRAILASIAQVRELVDILRNRSRHELRHEDNYIQGPKPDGYRSHHMIFNYKGRGAAAIYDGRRIEVQIRTRLQHSWATAVEAIGMFRGEDLKGNKGNLDWLRFFQLMSAEFALVEGCSELPGLPTHRERVREIVQLNRTLKAANTLDNLSYAVDWTNVSVGPWDRPTYYLISFDNTTNQVEVLPYFRPVAAVKSYENAERRDNRSGNETRNIVLVEADKLENLKQAYPNYFGDVQLFKRQLKNILGRKAPKEYTIKPQAVVPVDREVSDISWFRRQRFGKPKGA